MRTLLVAALAVSSMPSPDAEACGGYYNPPEPTVMMVASHTMLVESGRSSMFVLLDEAAPKGLSWRRVAPRSFDYAKIADAPQPDSKRSSKIEITLVGPGGTRVVSTAKRVFLTPGFGESIGVAALQVEVAREEEQPRIALAGAHPKATWRELDSIATTRLDVEWVKAQGIAIAGRDANVHVSRLPGLKIEAVSVYPPGQATMVTFLRDGTRNLGQYDGRPVGVVGAMGTHLVLARTTAAAYAIRL